MRKLVSNLLTLTILLATLWTTGSFAQNRLSNHGFENDSQDWTLQGDIAPHLADFFISTERVQGEKAFGINLLANSGTNEPWRVNVRQLIPHQLADTFIFSFWANASASIDSCLAEYQTDGEHVNLGLWQRFRMEIGWKKYEFSFMPLQDQVGKLSRVQLNVAGKNRVGITVLIDDVYFGPPIPDQPDPDPDPDPDDSTLVKTGFPRLANFYYDDFITEVEARDLAKWDVVVLGVQNPYLSPKGFELIKQLDSTIVLLCYINTIGRSQDSTKFVYPDPRYIQRAGSRDEWLLKDAAGNSMGFWPGAEIMNPTRYAPLINGRRWNTYIPDYAAWIWSIQKGWSGFLWDDAMPTIAWLNNGQIDVNNDGINDSWQYVDREWVTGLLEQFVYARSILGDSVIMVTNSSNTYGIYTNGRQFESVFVDADGWNATKDSIQHIIRYGNYSPRYVLVNANTGNTGNRTDWRRFRFAFCSTLLTDAFFSYDFGDQWHGQTWWYDEYDSDLGMPLGEAYQVKPGVWRRDFERGINFVNVTSIEQVVDLGDNYQHLIGIQDTTVNNGRTVSEVTIPSLDGRVLKGTRTTGVDNESTKSPSVFHLEQNYPNPFNPETTVEFSLPVSSAATFTIYNLLGQRIFRKDMEIVKGEKVTVRWDGKDNTGNVMPSGVYFYQVRAGSHVATKRMTLQK